MTIKNLENIKSIAVALTLQRMFRTVAAALIIVSSLTVQARPIHQYAFYDNNPMSQVNQSSAAQLQQYSEMVVGFAFSDRISSRHGRMILKQIPLSDEYRMCPDQEMAKQPSSFFCSGVFIDKNRILTAGHCATDITCKEFVMVRNAQVSAFEFGFPSDRVFTCKKIQMLPGYDRALIHTQEEYSGPYASIKSSAEQNSESKIFMVGHPMGLPLYLSRGVIQSQQPDRYIVRMTAFEGNSGAPVFSFDSGRLMGLLVEGDKDFQRDPTTGCNRIVRCAEGQCKGETVTRVTKEQIP